MSERYVQLPNGDLWKGVDVARVRNDNVTLEAPASVEDAVVEMLRTQTGEMLNCIWCGQQFSRKHLNELSEHVEALHPLTTKPISDAEALAAATELNIIAKVAAPKLA